MNVSRGPFPSSKDWMNARIQLVEGDCRRILNSQDADKDDIADMEEVAFFRSSGKSFRYITTTSLDTI